MQEGQAASLIDQSRSLDFFPRDVRDTSPVVPSSIDDTSGYKNSLAPLAVSVACEGAQSGALYRKAQVTWLLF